MTDIINIPLNKLSLWDGNVRKTKTKGFIDELAASIKAHGLQQNLIVKKDGRKFAVVAGGQRLKALQQLADAGDIEASHLVACKLANGESDATELSLAENAVRENMHPADEFDAFRKLIDNGAPVADVAARFGVTETLVQKRLKLARVNPAIVKAYRQDELTLEQLQAFAVSDDQEAQHRVWVDIKRQMDRYDDRDIRAMLTESDIAASDKRVKFVTLKAYQKAGGTLKRDLFSDGEDGVFILDVALLDKLVTEKLEKAAKPLRKEGWKWIEIHADFGYETRTQFKRCYPELVPLTPEQAAELQKLEAEYHALVDQHDGIIDDETPAPSRLDELEELIDKLNDRDECWPPETLAIAGAIVTIGYDGNTCIERGLIRPEDAPKKSAKPKSSITDDGQAPSPAFSAALIESLTAHKSAALSAELLQRPDIALVAVVHALASDVLLGASDLCVQITATSQSPRPVEGSASFAQLEAARETWGRKIPATPEDLWTWCLAQDQSVLLDLLAFCTATMLKADEDIADAVARTALRPSVQAAITIREYTKVFGEVSMAGLVDELVAQSSSASKGDLARAEGTLTTQAHTLDVLFHFLMQRSKANMGEYFDAAVTLMKLGLRAQAQCRATIETLAAIKNPTSVAFVRQANIAAGPQQVNNGVAATSQPSRAEEKENAPNKLLEAQHGERLDTRAPGATSGANPELETVGAIHGTAHGRGKVKD